MSDLRRTVDEIPITLVIAIAYLTLFVVTDPFGDDNTFNERLAAYGWLTPVTVAAGEPWRLLSHAFLHGGVLHILFNLSTLFALGPALERTLGSVKFTVLYVAAALGGGLAVCVIYDPLQPVVGGSGALFGMLGAAIAINMRAGRHLLAFLDFEGPRRLIGTIVVYLLLGMWIPFVSNTGHVGGLLAGFVVTFLWLAPGEPSRARTHWRAAIAALFAGLLFWSLVPATRFDWLRHQAERSHDVERQAALLRAAARAESGLRQPPEDLMPPRDRGR